MPKKMKRKKSRRKKRSSNAIRNVVAPGVGMVVGSATISSVQGSVGTAHSAPIAANAQRGLQLASVGGITGGANLALKKLKKLGG
jgi:hypothetical protein